MENALTVLGLSESATTEEVREAYRTLARRWHPDRFPDGPERMWAEQKMIQINRAYQEVLKSRHPQPGTNNKSFGDVRRMVEMGQLMAARQALMSIAVRDAEWNYLFGDVLFRLGEYKKAALYLSVAAHQSPDNRAYRTAYDSARVTCVQRRLQELVRNVTSPLAQRTRRLAGK